MVSDQGVLDDVFLALEVVVSGHDEILFRVATLLLWELLLLLLLPRLSCGQFGKLGYGQQLSHQEIDLSNVRASFLLSPRLIKHPDGTVRGQDRRQLHQKQFETRLGNTAYRQVTAVLFILILGRGLIQEDEDVFVTSGLEDIAVGVVFGTDGASGKIVPANVEQRGDRGLDDQAMTTTESFKQVLLGIWGDCCLLYTSPSPRD